MMGCGVCVCLCVCCVVWCGLVCVGCGVCVCVCVCVWFGVVCVRACVRVCVCCKLTEVNIFLAFFDGNDSDTQAWLLTLSAAVQL